MLNYVDFAIVMVSGNEKLKKEAKYITDTNENCGASRALDFINFFS